MSNTRNKLQRHRAQIRRVKTERQERDNRREKVVIYKSAAAFFVCDKHKKDIANTHDSTQP